MKKLNIGFTFNLEDDYPSFAEYPEDYYAEFDSSVTINEIVSSIKGIGHSVDLIGDIEGLVRCICAEENSWDLVFNVAEGLHGRARESQIPALLEAYQIPYVGSDALTLSLTLDKALTKEIWRSNDLSTTDYIVCRDQDTAMSSHQLCEMTFPLFVKPIREGSSKGIDKGSIVHNEEELGKRVNHLLAIYEQDVLVEPYLPGREFTVGIVGSEDSCQILEVLELHQKEISDFKSKKAWNNATFSPLPSSELKSRIIDLAVGAYRAVNCLDFGRVDIRCDAEDQPYLLEINPLPGMRPNQSALPIMAKHISMSYLELVNTILDQAIKRLGITV